MSEVRILLAEDNSEHQHLLLLALVRGRPRVSVTVVNRGSEFLKSIEQNTYDCAIVDYNLHQHTAPELIKTARESLSGCPVLVVSSNQNQAVVIESIRSGVVDFVPKMQAVQGSCLWQRVEACILESRRRKRDRRRTERRERYLAKISETDPLTGFYNRRYLDRCLRENRWQSDRRRTCSCVMLDIDHFKHVNDTFGHPQGDSVLRSVAGAIQEHLHPSDTAIRYGGEEFLVIRPSSPFCDTWLWSENLRKKIQGLALSLNGQEHRVTVSMGVADIGQAPLNQATIEWADRALYLAKGLGRDKVCTWTMVQVQHILDRIDTIGTNDLAHAHRVFLDHCGELLGPTQREHVTAHADRVAVIAVRIAHVMGHDREQTEKIRLGGLLHDIGKCLIPETLLSKPRSLAIEEWQLLAQHTELGAMIASRLGADPDIVEMIRHHHTRYDNHPHHHLGCHTHTGARVLCVADALATMLTDRVYRQRNSTEQAFNELQREQGKQFDPDVVEAAVRACSHAGPVAAAV